MVLFMVGYMGCGKTSMSKRLAKRLGMRFVDTDTMVEQIEGATIADIFRYEGEEYFRKIERQMLERSVASGDDVVVSTGGGLPAWGDNMEYMNRSGKTIYLRRSAEQIASRLSPYGRQKRPKLRGLNDEELIRFMRENMAEREPFYAKSHLVVDGGGLSDNEILNTITDWIGNGR